MRTRKFSLMILVLLLIANVLFWAPHSLARRASTFEQLGLLVDLRHELVEGYVKEPDQKKLVEAAVRGMIESLEDPYTTYLSPEDLAQFDKHVRGSFSGIGAEVMIDDQLNRLKIVTPLEDSPAWNSGVMAGDIVLEIDGVDTEGMKISDCVDRLTGPEGTKVVILVRHESGEQVEITVTRARINIQTVRGFRRDTEHHWDWMIDRPNKIGYVRLTQFTERTAGDLEAAIKSLNEEGAKALILDVRSNPGGLLDSAIAISDMFLPGGKVVVSVKGRKVREQIERSTDTGTLFKGEVVVLINEASASASEIVSGALKDNGRAHVVGTRTFGKGSVQQLRQLEDDQGALKMTNAYYYIPSGRKIHRIKDSETWGVDPHEGSYVGMTPNQIRDMIKIRREGDILRPDGDQDQKPITVEMIKEELKDLQLAAALTAAHGKLKTGEWSNVGSDGIKEQVLLSRRANLLRQRDLIKDRLKEIAEEVQKIDDKVEGKIPMEADDAVAEDSPLKGAKIELKSTAPTTQESE